MAVFRSLLVWALEAYKHVRDTHKIMGMDVTGVFRPMTDRTNESFSLCGPVGGYEVIWHCALSMQNPESFATCEESRYEIAPLKATL